MDLTNWIIILAAALLGVAFFCLRTRAEWSLENRARRRTGTRLIVQAVVASWSALLIVVHGASGLARSIVPHYTPSMLLLGALLLSEPITARLLVGLAAVAIGIVVVNRR